MSHARPDRLAYRAASFTLHAGFTLAGGYAGLGADDPDERDVELYETILSGDLAGNDDGFEHYDDNAQHLKDDDAHSVWLGAEVLYGAHPAHTF